jgi:hypothetical protein
MVLMPDNLDFSKEIITNPSFRRVEGVVVDDGLNEEIRDQTTPDSGPRVAFEKFQFRSQAPIIKKLGPMHVALAAVLAAPFLAILAVLLTGFVAFSLLFLIYGTLRGKKTNLFFGRIFFKKL